MNRLKQRTPEDWMRALGGSGDADPHALSELRVYLERTLRRAFFGRDAARDDDLAEWVQETFARILEAKDRFRGDSAFPTWAAAIATRVAFTALRRKEVRERRRDDFDAIEADVRNMEDSAKEPIAELSNAGLLRALHGAIATQLTERQRIAVVAELRGLPTIEIAARLGTNQNALYKLVHDARKRLRSALIAAGFTADTLDDLANQRGAR